jgi:hypothetical protein
VERIDIVLFRFESELSSSGTGHSQMRFLWEIASIGRCIGIAIPEEPEAIRATELRDSKGRAPPRRPLAYFAITFIAVRHGCRMDCPPRREDHRDTSIAILAFSR